MGGSSGFYICICKVSAVFLKIYGHTCSVSRQ